jgi:type IV pilus assembly protein PilM
MRWFPFSSFTVSPIALHISDHTCAVLRLNSKNEIVSFGRALLPQGVMEGGLVRDRKQLGEHIRTACARALPKPIRLDEEVPVIFSIPESQSFTHLFTVSSSLPDEYIAKTIQKKAGEIIPAPLDSLYTDWHIVEENVGGNDRILFAAAPREIIDAYIAVCEEVNLLPLAIDMETISLARALLPDDGKASVIIDIGSRTTTLGFFDEQHRLGLSLSLPIAGNNFTRALIDRLHVSFEDAEELKRSSGLSRALPDNRSMVILQEQLQLMLPQLRKATSYFESTYHKAVTSVVLAGGEALIPDIAVYLAMNLKCDVVLGNPLTQLGKAAAQILGEQESVAYAPARPPAHRKWVRRKIRRTELF